MAEVISTEKSLVLEFNVGSSDTLSVTITSPNTELTAEQVSTYMDELISSGAIGKTVATSLGTSEEVAISTKLSAQYVTVTKTSVIED